MTKVSTVCLMAESYDSLLRCQLNGLIQSKCLRRGILSAHVIKAGFVCHFHEKPCLKIRTIDYDKITSDWTHF